MHLGTSGEGLRRVWGGYWEGLGRILAMFWEGLGALWTPQGPFSVVSGLSWALLGFVGLSWLFLKMRAISDGPHL